MKSSFICCLVFIITAASSCSRHILKSEERVGKEKDFDTISYNYLYGEALHQKIMGNAGEALKYFEQCIRINPQGDAPYYQIAQISVQRGDLQNGKKFAVKASNLDDRNIWYLTLTGDIF